MSGGRGFQGCGINRNRQPLVFWFRTQTVAVQSVHNRCQSGAQSVFNLNVRLQDLCQANSRLEKVLEGLVIESLPIAERLP